MDWKKQLSSPALVYLHEMYQRLIGRSTLYSQFRADAFSFALCAMELSVVKKIEPACWIDWKGFGCEMAVPIDDEHLLQGLAMAFAQYLPVYS